MSLNCKLYTHTKPGNRHKQKTKTIRHCRASGIVPNATLNNYLFSFCLCTFRRQGSPSITVTIPKTRPFYIFRQLTLKRSWIVPVGCHILSVSSWAHKGNYPDNTSTKPKRTHAAAKCSLSDCPFANVHALDTFTSQRHKPLRRAYGSRLWSWAGVGCYGGRNRIHRWIHSALLAPYCARSESWLFILPPHVMRLDTKVILTRLWKIRWADREKERFYSVLKLLLLTLSLGTLGDRLDSGKLVNIDFCRHLPFSYFWPLLRQTITEEKTWFSKIREREESMLRCGLLAKPYSPKRSYYTEQVLISDSISVQPS